MKLNGGTVDRGEMARVDVFRKASKKGKFQYFLVPIYPHEIATMDAPPARAVLASDQRTNGRSSILRTSFFGQSIKKLAQAATKTNGEIVEGYFVGMNRSNGAIALSDHADPDAVTSGIGVKTLLSLQKFSVNRLGRVGEVSRELRTWRGKVCT